MTEKNFKELSEYKQVLEIIRAGKLREGEQAMLVLTEADAMSFGISRHELMETVANALDDELVRQNITIYRIGTAENEEKSMVSLIRRKEKDSPK